MTSRRCAGMAGMVLALLAAAGPWAHAATYRLDPRETTANFEVRFLGVFPIRGEFRRTTGTLVYDAAARRGSIEVSIDTTTLEASTANAQASARGPDFFEVDKYPSIDFKSSRFVFDENRLRFVEGNLTLVGKTRPVILNVSDSQCVTASEQQPARCRATAELRVRRSDFGMKAWSNTVGEEVTIRISISAIRVESDPAGDTQKEMPKEPQRDSPRDPIREVPRELPKPGPTPEVQSPGRANDWVRDVYKPR